MSPLYPPQLQKSLNLFTDHLVEVVSALEMARGSLAVLSKMLLAVLVLEALLLLKILIPSVVHAVAPAVRAVASAVGTVPTTVRAVAGRMTATKSCWSCSRSSRPHDAPNLGCVVLG